MEVKCKYAKEEQYGDGGSTVVCKVDGKPCGHYGWDGGCLKEENMDFTLHEVHVLVNEYRDLFGDVVKVKTKRRKRNESYKTYG